MTATINARRIAVGFDVEGAFVDYPMSLGFADGKPDIREREGLHTVRSGKFLRDEQGRLTIVPTKGASARTINNLVALGMESLEDDPGRCNDVEDIWLPLEN